MKGGNRTTQPTRAHMRGPTYAGSSAHSPPMHTRVPVHKDDSVVRRMLHTLWCHEPCAGLCHLVAANVSTRNVGARVDEGGASCLAICVVQRQSMVVIQGQPCWSGSAWRERTPPQRTAPDLRGRRTAAGRRRRRRMLPLRMKDCMERPKVVTQWFQSCNDAATDEFVENS